MVAAAPQNNIRGIKKSTHHGRKLERSCTLKMFLDMMQANTQAHQLTTQAKQPLTQGRRRDELNNPLEERDGADTLAKGSLMLKEKEKETQAGAPAPRREVAGGNPVPSCRDVKEESEILRINIERIFQIAGYQFLLEIM